MTSLSIFLPHENQLGDTNHWLTAGPSENHTPSCNGASQIPCFINWQKKLLPQQPHICYIQKDLRHKVINLQKKTLWEIWTLNLYLKCIKDSFAFYCKILNHMVFFKDYGTTHFYKFTWVLRLCSGRGHYNSVYSWYAHQCIACVNCVNQNMIAVNNRKKCVTRTDSNVSYCNTIYSKLPEELLAFETMTTP